MGTYVRGVERMCSFLFNIPDARHSTFPELKRNRPMNNKLLVRFPKSPRSIFGKLFSAANAISQKRLSIEIWKKLRSYYLFLSYYHRAKVTVNILSDFRRFFSFYKANKSNSRRSEIILLRCKSTTDLADSR